MLRHTARAQSEITVIENSGWNVSGAMIASRSGSLEQVHNVFSFVPERPIEDTTMPAVLTGMVRIENHRNPGKVFEYLLEKIDDQEIAHEVILPKYIGPGSIYLDDNYGLSPRRLTKASAAIIKTIDMAAHLPVGSSVSKPETHRYDFAKIASLEPILAFMGTVGSRELSPVFNSN
jgi:hypothetical protein